MPRITLRIPNSDNKYSPQVLNTIKTILGEAEPVGYDSELPILKIHQERADGLLEAFEFLLKAHPPENYKTDHAIDRLVAYARYCRNNCAFETYHDVVTLRTVLAHFAKQLIAVLTDICRWPEQPEHKISYSEAVRWLNEADQFTLMQQEQKEIATLVPLEIANQKYLVLQWERNIPFAGKEFYQDLEKIKKLDAPVTPSWFRDLKKSAADPKANKIYKDKIMMYLLNVIENIGTIKDLKQEIEAFSMLWKLTLSDQQKVLDKQLNHLQSNQNSKDIYWFHSLKEHRKSLILHAKTKENITEIMNDLKKIIENKDDTFITDLKNIKALPYWYTELPTNLQYFTKKIVRDANSIDSAIQKLSSRFRFYPALSNTRGHNLYLLDSEGNILLNLPERMSFSHICSRDVMNMDPEIIEKHVKNNLDTIISFLKPEQKLFIQTLISPLKLLEYLPKMVTNWLPPDNDLYRYLKSGIQAHPRAGDIIMPNHPLNVVRLISATSNQSEETMKLFNLAKESILQSEECKTILKDFESLLNSGWGSGTWRDNIARELTVSSVEQIVVILQGYLSTGSCVSGKDRKSIELIHTDAMKIYYALFKKFPINVSAEERKIFVYIFACLFRSYHHQTHAATNAKGVIAIQNAHKYLPQDMIDHINNESKLSNILKVESDLATYNELSKLVGKTPLPYNPRLSFEIAAYANEPKDLQTLIDALYNLIQQRNWFMGSDPKDVKAAEDANKYPFFKREVNISIVKEIEDLNKLLLDRKDMLERKDIKIEKVMAEIFELVAGFKKDDDDRVGCLLKLIWNCYQSGNGSIKNAICRLDEMYSNSTKTEPRALIAIPTC